MGQQMWFGTEGRMRWVDVPMSGADVSPQGYSMGGILQNGGGYQETSFGSHKQYIFAWSAASSRRAAGIMQSYARGTFGRGLLYFIDPLTYDTNILPAHWADPSSAADSEAPALIRSRRLKLTTALTSNPDVNDLPSRTAVYDMGGAAVGFPGEQDSLFIPVPPGSTLRIGAFYEATGSAGIFAAPVDAIGTAGAPVRLTELAGDAQNIIPDEILPGALGVRLWIGKTAEGAATLSITAMVARILSSHIATVDSHKRFGPWVEGDGHSGCRPSGKPTKILYNGVDGGQVGYALTLREVGAWEY